MERGERLQQQTGARCAALLLKAKTPVIMVLARRMYREIPEELKAPLDQGRLLIISTSASVRQSRITTLAQNRYICEIADQIMMVGVTDGSSLYGLSLPEDLIGKTTVF